jgi:septal ring factor EnvC (AmiA/AmiB activator)
MNTVAFTRAYANLSEQLGKSVAENLTAFVAETVREDVHNSTKELTTKSDLAEVKSELRVEISEVKSELKAEIAQVRVEISEVKSELIKWMFIFWAGQLAAIFGLLYFFIKR